MSSIYENLFNKALYPAYETWLRGRKTFSYLAEYESQQWWSRDQIRQLQLDKLKRLLEHCQVYVPYYRDLWKKLGFDWRDVRSLADFQRLTPIGKEDIREHYDRFIAEPFAGKTLRKTTGGSTGKPFSFEYTQESYERRMAVMMRGYAWAGARPGAKRLDIWGGDLGLPPVWKRWKNRAYEAVQRRKVLPSFEMRRDNLQSYVRAIDSYRPHVIVGYTSALETLASYMLDKGCINWKPASVITAAEMLSDSQRQLIADAFGAPVFHTYGCREFMLMGAECEHHRGYHASDDHLVTEVVGDDGVPLTSGAGNVLITDLHNYGMPFLRYANGDLAQARIDDTPCPCGRGLGWLGAVEGRRLDRLFTTDGRIIPGEFFPHLVKEVSAVEQFQVRQKTLDMLELWIVPRGRFEEHHEAFLRDHIRRVAGDQVQLQIRIVDEIPLTPSGKRRVTVSELEPGLP